MGRTSIMLVLVFNMTFMFMGYRLSTVTSIAYQKYAGYSKIEQVGLALESAGNIAISNALLTTDPIANDTILCSNDTLAGITFTIDRRKMTNAIGAKDGDSIIITGQCPININGTTYTITCNTGIRIRGNSFSQFVFYSQVENGIQWINGEICWGRLHTQDKLTISGSGSDITKWPDFKGKVTTKGGVTSSKANFEQGCTYADVSVPTKLDDLNTYGQTGNGGAYYQGVDTYVQFMKDGEVVVRAATAGTASATAWSYSSAQASTTVSDGKGGPSVPEYKVYSSVAALASSGVLLVQDAELHITGVLNGQITLGCVDSQSGSPPVNSGKSSVWIDSTIAYHQAPPSYQYQNNVSSDMLGIVATNNITVSQYVYNNSSSSKVTMNGTSTSKTELDVLDPTVTINASMFCQASGKGFGAENPGSRQVATLHLVGGIQQNTRQIVGQNGYGFSKDYDWDLNLLNYQPKGYPKTTFMVQNWVDNTSIPPQFYY